jgi:hypothetical protein
MILRQIWRARWRDEGNSPIAFAEAARRIGVPDPESRRLATLAWEELALFVELRVVDPEEDAAGRSRGAS